MLLDEELDDDKTISALRPPTALRSQPPCFASHIRPRSLRLAHLLRPWLPVIMYAVTSFVFLVAIAFYRPEMFTFLDDLSHWLRSDLHFGYAVLFSLIFLTTIPPFPLYSTFISLSGYTFGAWTGALLSYFAALSGAIFVFVVSRAFFRDPISRWLSATRTIQRVVRAVEKRPTLLFLIRLAPYPFNVMNCLLAAAPSLSLRTFAVCTALSLFKVIVHTSIGASVHSFKEHHSVAEHESSRPRSLAELWTVLGTVLCVVVVIYISIIARRAVDEELIEDDDYVPVSAYAGDAEETIGFLSPAAMGSVSDFEIGSHHSSMGESPFRATHPVAHRVGT